MPIGRFPGVLEPLPGTPARLEERTRAILVPALTRAPAGRWLVQQNVGHLVDAEPRWLRRAEQFFTGEPKPAPAELTTRRIDHAIVARTAIHPRLQQSMRLIDLAELVADHDDHHLAAITELIE